MPFRESKIKKSIEVEEVEEVKEQEEEKMKLENVLREKEKDYYKETEEIVTRDFIDGELPKAKKLLSTSRLEFYRDGKGMVEFEEMD